MAASRPNILILFTDMQRADTVQALGNAVIRTPHLDQLTAAGTAFTSCYSPSPVCVPARCCLHYGLYPQRTGLFDNGAMMPDNDCSYPAVLGRAGYRTHSVGKCHFTPDHKALRGFQSRRIQEDCMFDPEQDDYVTWLRERGYDAYEPHGTRSEMYYIPQISSQPAASHPSQWVGDESIRFIETAVSAAQPWCLFAGFTHPHPPFAPPKPWHKLYRAADMPLPFVPDNWESLLTWVNRFQNRYKYRDRGVDLNLVRAMKAYYYATISFVDYQVGRILAALAAAGQTDNTLILFTSDHGEFLGDFNCFGKRSMHAAAVRVPLLIRFPGRVPAGLCCPTPVSLVDVLPTVLGAAGTDSGIQDPDGIDLATVAAGAAPGRTVYSQFERGPKGIYMAAAADWRYVYSAGDRAEFLFDGRVSAGEAGNLAASPSAQAPLEALRERLLRYLEETGMRDAYVRRGGQLAWRRHPSVDESYLQEPDEALLRQDYAGKALHLPGYTDR